MAPWRFEKVPADERAADGEKCLVHVGASFVANEQPAETMQPGEGPFDDPARDTQAAAVRRAAAAEDGNDAEPTEPAPMTFGVVPAVALQHGGPATGTAPPAPDAAQGAHQRIELRDVVDVRRADLAYQGNAVGLDDDVVFRAFLTAIGWVRSSFFPPRSARRDALSTTAQRRSSRPRRRSSASSTSCRRRQTPARCHRTSRRQQLLPDPQPISFGSICHGIPLRSTNRMPVRAARFEMGGRPIRLRRDFGSNASIRAHKSSSSNRLDLRMADRTKRAAHVQGVGQGTFETHS